MREFQELQIIAPEQLEKLQLEKLNRLLNHAYNNVAYYNDVFSKSGLLKNGSIQLNFMEELSQIPFLTKDIIREQESNLFSRDHDKRKSYMNSSGGSTGEPVRILQDKDYLLSNLAAFNLAKAWRNSGPYDSEIILWGAERDTFEGRKPLSSYAGDFLRNRIMLNCFKMSQEDMCRFIRTLNRHRPSMIRTYADAIYELALFARKNHIAVEPQRAIHTTAGTLHAFMRREIEDVFQCGVFDHYGSREAGSIASECSAHDGMHVIWGYNHVEVVDSEGSPCRPGQEGEIVVTNLENYSMPLIRYKIGDLGILKEPGRCECGCNFPRLASVSGRTSDVFRTRDGRVISPVYFAHLLGVVKRDSGIGKFQVIQKGFEHIKVKLAANPESLHDTLADITSKIKQVMGDDCKVEYEFVNDIETTNTGKTRHTVSEIT